jgi:hypothetical protein
MFAKDLDSCGVCLEPRRLRLGCIGQDRRKHFGQVDPIVGEAQKGEADLVPVLHRFRPRSLFGSERAALKRLSRAEQAPVPRFKGTMARSNDQTFALGIREAAQRIPDPEELCDDGNKRRLPDTSAAFGLLGDPGESGQLRRYCKERLDVCAVLELADRYRLGTTA